MKIPTFSYFFDLSFYLTPCQTQQIPPVTEAWHNADMYSLFMN